jgi:hypothetical protein
MEPSKGVQFVDFPAEVLQEIARSLSIDEILNLCDYVKLNDKLCNDGPFIRELAKKYLTDYPLNDDETELVMDDFADIIFYESNLFGQSSAMEDNSVKPVSADFPKLKNENWYTYISDEMSEIEYRNLTVEYIDFLVNRGYEKRLIGYLKWIEPFPIYIFVSLKNGYEPEANKPAGNGAYDYRMNDEVNPDYIWAFSAIQYALYLTVRYNLDYLYEDIRDRVINFFADNAIIYDDLLFIEYGDEAELYFELDEFLTQMRRLFENGEFIEEKNRMFG